mmetsp:Transcript_45751/g.145811  ORF Transcript_45751/g.145811 Transcript_45751/m.145811 type:complete len:229 (+) Transcript_45751:890-1576(+)
MALSEAPSMAMMMHDTKGPGHTTLPIAIGGIHMSMKKDLTEPIHPNGSPISSFYGKSPGSAFKPVAPGSLSDRPPLPSSLSDRDGSADAAPHSRVDGFAAPSTGAIAVPPRPAAGVATPPADMPRRPGMATPPGGGGMSVPSMGQWGGMWGSSPHVQWGFSPPVAGGVWSGTAGTPPAGSPGSAERNGSGRKPTRSVVARRPPMQLPLGAASCMREVLLQIRSFRGLF